MPRPLPGTQDTEGTEQIQAFEADKLGVPPAHRKPGQRAAPPV
ncbi:MAG: hypothetical protein ABI977_37160 [Acidobacteriota bacterium]